MLKPLTITHEEENKVKQNLQQLKGYFRNRIYPERQRGVKAYNMDSTDRRMQDHGCAIVESNFYTQHTKRTVDGLFNKLYDTQNQYDVHEKGGEDYTCDDHGEDEERHINSSDKIADIVEDGFQAPDSRRDFYTSVKTMVIVGNGFGEARIKDYNGCPETMVSEVGPFSLYFMTNQDFYDSGLPVIKRGIKSMSNIIQELAGYGIEMKSFKAKWNEEKTISEERKIREDEERKLAKKNGKEYKQGEVVNQAFDKRDDEKIREARFHGDFLVCESRKTRRCNVCHKDECTCKKMPYDNKLSGPKSNPLDGLYAFDNNDQLHEFSLYWIRDYLFVIIDDVVILKYDNPISNPCGKMTSKEKDKIADYKERIKNIKEGRSKKQKEENMEKKEKLKKELERYESKFGVDYFGPYHPYYKLDIDPNSRGQIQMGFGPNMYEEQLLYNKIFNTRVDKRRMDMDLGSMFVMGEGQKLKLKGSNIDLKDGMLPIIPGAIFEIEGQGPGLRVLGEGSATDPHGLDILQYLDGTADRKAGLTSVTGGAEKGIQRVPGAVESLRQVTAQNLQPMVESMSHGMSRIVLVRQKLLLNYMDKYDLDEIEVRKRRGGKTLVTRDDLKKDFHIIVNNKSLTTLQNFNTTIGKINAIGQIQSLLINPITGDPYFDMKPVLKDIFDDLDLPCDMELTHKEVMDMRKQQIKDTAKLERMTIKQQGTSQITQAVVQEKVQDKLQERAQKRQADIQAELAEEAEKEIRRQEREARRREVQQPVQQQPQPTDLAPSNNLGLSDQELQLLSQSTGVPIEQILGQAQEQPIIERIEGDTTGVDDTGAEDFGEF